MQNKENVFNINIFFWAIQLEKWMDWRIILGTLALTGMVAGFAGGFSRELCMVLLKKVTG